MVKTLKSAAQLTALINAELSKHAVCNQTGAKALNQLQMFGSRTTGHVNFSGGRAMDRRRIANRCLLQSCINFSKSMISLPRNDRRFLLGDCRACELGEKRCALWF